MCHCSKDHPTLSLHIQLFLPFTPSHQACRHQIDLTHNYLDLSLYSTGLEAQHDYFCTTIYPSSVLHWNDEQWEVFSWWVHECYVSLMLTTSSRNSLSCKGKKKKLCLVFIFSWLFQWRMGASTLHSNKHFALNSPQLHCMNLTKIPSY